MKKVVSLFKQVAQRLYKLVLARVPARMLRTVLVRVAITRAHTLSPIEGLRLLFGIEADLYPAQGQLSSAYDSGIHTKHRHMRYHDFFVARVRPGEWVLDIGCGIGEVAYKVAERAQASVVGIDLNPANIARAQQRNAHERVSYVVGDALKTLPSSRFDVVILSNVLEHLPSRPQFLRQVSEFVQPARLLIRVPLFERDWRVPLKKEIGIEWRLDPTHETEYTLETFAEEMHEARLNITHLEVRWGEIWSELEPQPHA
jgi:2-polyprenyl-3-methyl-5-hydroxy-6-metoxy-1,4-benzoquinol methylase